MKSDLKVVNLMNFVRQIDERTPNSTEQLLAFTAEQLRLVNEYGVDNTFLLQYDAICDPDFVSLFQNEATEHTELGLWYEIVEPLATACHIPYRSEQGWKWDWHIVPGFSMAYSPAQREALMDEAMRKFKEVFGFYPKTVASWLIDTHTVNYLAEHYDISAIAICRDQANTDAYTLLGGYFNQAYYPSKNNMFTPAQHREMQNDVPVFRLLGPCPIHNYDNNKYSSEELRALGRRSACFTLEPGWYLGSHEETVEWMFRCYYDEESLGFSYAQIGQENSFFKMKEQVFSGMRLQIESLMKRGDVSFLKMKDTGEAFKKRYPNETPATSVVAPNHFDRTDVQSVYYDCKNYTANLFRFEDKVFLRSLFLFDEENRDRYLENTCTTFDAVYENLPIVDTQKCPESERKQCGLMLESKAKPFSVEKPAEGVLKVVFGEESVTFEENRIEIRAKKTVLYANSVRAQMRCTSDGLTFCYQGRTYRLGTDGAEVIPQANGNVEIRPQGTSVFLYPKTVK